MNKSCLILACTFLFTTFLTGQTYKPKWGKTNKIEGGSLRATFESLGIVEDYYYAYNAVGDGGKLLQFGMDNKLVSEKELNVQYEGKSLYVYEFIETSKGAFAYLYDPNEKGNDWTFYAASFDDGNFGVPQRNFSLSSEPSAYEKGLLNSVELSKNKNHVAFIRSKKQKSKKADKEVFVALMDADLNVQWTKELILPYPKKDILLKQVVVGDDGTIYLSAQYENPKTKRSKGAVKYDYKVFIITETNTEEANIRVLKGLLPTTIALFPNEVAEKGVLVTGLFMPDVKKSNITGTFVASLDKKSVDISNVKLHYFDKKDEKSVYGDKAEDENLHMELEYGINGLFTFSDGSFGFVAERSFYRQQTTPTGEAKPSGSLNLFVTYSLRIPIFSSNGDFLKIAGVSKGFSHVTKEYCSYAMANHNDKLYFVFNDGVSQKELRAYLKKQRAKSKGKKGKKSKDKKSKQRPMFTDLAIVNKSGELEFDKMIFTNQTVGKEFLPHLCDFENGMFLLGAANMGKYRFGLLNLKEK